MSDAFSLNGDISPLLVRKWEIMCNSAVIISVLVKRVFFAMS